MESLLSGVLARCAELRLVDSSGHTQVLRALGEHGISCSWTSGGGDSHPECKCYLMGCLESLASRIKERIDLAKMNLTLQKIKHKPRSTKQQAPLVNPEVSHKEDSLFKGEFMFVPAEEDRSLRPEVGVTQTDVVLLQELQQKRVSQLLSECAEYEMKIVALERTLKHTEVLLRDQEEKWRAAAKASKDNIREWSSAVRTNNLANMALRSSRLEEQHEDEVVSMNEVLRTSHQVV